MSSGPAYLIVVNMFYPYQRYFMLEEMGRFNKNAGSAAKFIHEPREFDGSGGDAVVWLKRMERLKGSAKLTDEEILYVAGDHLVEKAETWFNVVGSRCKTWDEFVVSFRSHYLQDQEDKWWYQLQNLKQGPEYPSVNDLALKMQELFTFLDNKSESLQVCTFLTAIHKHIACEIEKEGTPKTFETARDKAKLIERSFLKYGAGVNAPFGSDLSSAGSVVGPSMDTGSVSSMMSMIDRLEKLSINFIKLDETLASRGGSTSMSPVGSVRRPLVCFFCNKEGHKKPDCPEFKNKQVHPATGSNAVEMGSRSGEQASGKDREYQ